MLEEFSKKEKNFVFDAHFHYAVCKKEGLWSEPENWKGISCAHSKEEFLLQKEAPDSVIQAYGMHPQNAGNENIADSTAFLEKLLAEGQIKAIGEAGFDYFTEEFRQAAKLQEEIWNIQLELAVKYQVPLIVHCRRANEKLFEYSNSLKKIPEVLFHSFMGSPVEAMSLLKRGINGYFSFGKQVLNGNKKVVACVRELPQERVLAETDAPFQYLKGEKYTVLEDIRKVYEAIICFQSSDILLY